jgi:hypothetical protein
MDDLGVNQELTLPMVRYAENHLACNRVVDCENAR